MQTHHLAAQHQQQLRLFWQGCVSLRAMPIGQPCVVNQ
jgi:hypothetical protein